MVKLTTLCAVYLSENPQLKSKTKKSKRWAFGHLIYLLGDKLIEKFTVDDCHRFRNALLAFGLKRSSVNIALREVAAVLEWAVSVKQILPSNPMRQVKQLKTSRLLTNISNYQLRQMINCSSSIWKARLLAGRLGLRRGEVLNLTQDDIKGGYILVQSKRQTVETWTWEPKTGESRAVLLSEELAGLLKSLGYYPMLSNRLYDNNIILQDKGLLTEERRECPDQNFNRDFRKIQQRVFGRAIGQFRDLRVAFITSSLEEGIPIHVVQWLAGHKSIVTTMTYYVCVRESFIESQREKLESSLKKGLPKKEELDQTPLPTQSGSPVNVGDTGIEPVTR